MLLMAPVSGVRKGRFKFRAVRLSADAAAAMIEMQMGEEHIGDIAEVKTF